MRDAVEQFVAGRHVIVLAVPWSVDAVRAVHVATSEKHLLDSADATLSVVDEDDPSVRDWLVKLQLRDSVEYAWGAGSILWMSDGKLLRFDSRGPTAAEFIATIMKLWQPSE